MDLYYPEFAQAKSEDEYLLGKNLLVSPATQDSAPKQVVPSEWLKTDQGEPGLHAEFFANTNLEGAPVLERTDKNIDFDWGTGSVGANVPQANISARWSGTVQVPAKVGNVVLCTVEDDGARLWIDGRQVINAWGPHDSVLSEANAVLTAGRPHQLRVEFEQLEGNAKFRLLWHRVVKNPVTVKSTWIPPGTWINSWNGEVVTGPAMVTNRVPLDQIPLFIRSGSIFPLAPEMQFTGQRPWNPITLDVYPKAGETDSALLYEDDTVSMAYQHGQYRETAVSVSASPTDHRVHVGIGAAHGTFAGAMKKRSWVLRIHPPAAWRTASAPARIFVDGKKTGSPGRWLPKNESAMPLGDTTGAPDGNILEVRLPAASVARARQIDVSFGFQNP